MAAIVLLGVLDRRHAVDSRGALELNAFVGCLPVCSCTGLFLEDAF